MKHNHKQSLSNWSIWILGIGAAIIIIPGFLYASMLRSARNFTTEIAEEIFLDNQDLPAGREIFLGQQDGMDLYLGETVTLGELTEDLKPLKIPIVSFEWSCDSYQARLGVEESIEQTVTQIEQRLHGLGYYDVSAQTGTHNYHRTRLDDYDYDFVGLTEENNELAMQITLYDTDSRVCIPSAFVRDFSHLGVEGAID